MKDYGTIIDGAARSDNILQGGIPVDMEAQTMLLDPNAYPFEVISRQINEKEATDQMKHEYREKRLTPLFTETTAAAAAGATSITVADYTRIKNDYLLYVPSTGEMLLVQDTSIDSTVDVVNASTGSGGIVSAIASDAKINILGEAHAEGETTPTATSNEPIIKSNYVMQKDLTITVTDIEEAIRHYGNEKKRDTDRRDGWIQYKKAQNLLYYVATGSREVASASGPRRHVCSGLLELITENVKDAADASDGLTLDTIASLIGVCKRPGASSDKKLTIVGVNGQMAISAWPREKLQVSVLEKKWGVRVNTLITGFGDTDIVYDSMLNEEYGLDSHLFVLDMKFIKQLYLRTMPVRLFADIATGNIHQKLDAISGTFGLQVKGNELHGRIYGIK
jgi:hypothetical protein